MSQHTPEPWQADVSDLESDVGEDIEISAPEAGVHIALVTTCWPTETEDDIVVQYDEGKGKANARRLVACVNACRGIDNYILETGWPSFAEVIGWRLDRDELLETCRSLFALSFYRRVYTEEQREEILMKASVVIGKMKGDT